MKTIRCQACTGRGVKRAFGNMGDEKCPACEGSGGVIIGASGKATLIPTGVPVEHVNGVTEKPADDAPKKVEMPAKASKKIKKAKKKKVKKLK